MLQCVFQMFPFNIKGDAHIGSDHDKLISCIIPTSNRAYEVDRILFCLAMQDMDTSLFEVIVIEDGMSDEIEKIVRRHSAFIDIKLKSNIRPLQSVGALRNQGLELSAGRYILFLDDDTFIGQGHFLSTLRDRFQTVPDIDCITVHGKADRCFLRRRYMYLNKYSFGAACIAYKRDFLIKLGGFFNVMTSYEDIELSVRFTIADGRAYRESELFYYHPPFYFSSWKKPISNGLSFLRTYKRYSFPVWLLCYINALRFLPFLFFPSSKLRQWGKISGGFLVAPLLSMMPGEWKNNSAYE